MSKTKAPKVEISWTVSETDKITQERCDGLSLGDRVRVGKGLTFAISQFLVRRQLFLRLARPGQYDVIALPAQTGSRGQVST